MCRVLSYLGNPIPAELLLYNPDNSFIKQTYNPKYMSHLLNLAGFGMVGWEEMSFNPTIPFLYKTTRLPFYDENLKKLAVKIKPNCLLAHIRGVSFTENRIVSDQNVHPFVFDGTKMALAHNGELSNFDMMKYDLLAHIKPEYAKQIHGTTDSEWIYAVFLSQLPDISLPSDFAAITDALANTFKIIQKVRQQHNINTTSPVNLFITNGNFIAATRFTLDYGWHSLDVNDSTAAAHSVYHSLWYTYGESYGYYDKEYKMKNSEKRSCIIIASEPLTEDTTTWIEVPEYTSLVAWRENDEIKIASRDIVI